MERISMKNRKLLLLTFIMTACLCFSGCGNKEESPNAEQTVENTVQEDIETTEAGEELTSEQEEYLKLVTEIDVLQQKKTMILSYYNNPELVMPIEQGAELMSAEERLGQTLKEDEEDTTEEDAYIIKNMHSFWTIYDNIKGSANPNEIPDENLDQMIQDLKTQKSELETEVSELEDELRSLT